MDDSAAWQIESHLDLISWSLRLPHLWQARMEAASEPIDLTERDRLDALITEGERALGILPPEGKDA